MIIRFVSEEQNQWRWWWSINGNTKHFAEYPTTAVWASIEQMSYWFKEFIVKDHK